MLNLFQVILAQRSGCFSDSDDMSKMAHCAKQSYFKIELNKILDIINQPRLSLQVLLPKTSLRLGLRAGAFERSRHEYIFHLGFQTPAPWPTI